MNTHISYETAKRLKEFLGDSAPEPMAKEWYHNTISFTYIEKPISYGKPAYQLHDLLSKPFCDAMAQRHKGSLGWTRKYTDLLQQELAIEYFNGGLPAVEKALVEMMEGK